ncbi:hypothetical protein [Allostreptomyces psammosilenae]|uniref:Uncharacterized protein n=1 Tax=Allostreptomyces psammosilenae TaxID=1892865 RepID=A0A853A249_9ACTN|nr:hypothetical protein [Allostreptomyces psammosilenae]NYI08197.1 hypothetical protein [Allostreptomyces psammosilenae]
MDAGWIRKAVAEGDGYAVVTVRRLREAIAATDQDAETANRIADELADAGFLHLPLTIPTAPDRNLLVYTSKSRLAGMVHLLAKVYERPAPTADRALELLAEHLPHQTT